MNLMEQVEKRRRIIHLANIDVERTASIQNVEGRCAAADGKTPAAVHWYAPDFEGERSIDFHVKGMQAVFSIPRMTAYGVVVVSW